MVQQRRVIRRKVVEEAPEEVVDEELEVVCLEPLHGPLLQFFSGRDLHISVFFEPDRRVLHQLLDGAWVETCIYPFPVIGGDPL